jgi:hypothetical protein
MSTPDTLRSPRVTRRILFALTTLTVFAAHSRGQTVTTQSDAFILKPKAAASSSPIRILEPRIVEGMASVVTDSLFRLKGEYAGRGVMLGGSVNDQPLVQGGAGTFGCVYPLRRGFNALRVLLRIKDAGTYSRTLNVIYDTAPPVIEVLEPRQEDIRGVRLLGTESAFMRAKVFDESGIREVLIDGLPVPLKADSTVSKEFVRFRGETTSIIVARDNAGHTQEHKVRIEYGGKQALDFMKWKNHALIIGIDQYKGEWPSLRNAVRDARAIELLLRQQFTFSSIRTLYNNEATRANILSTLEGLAEELGPEDNLFIYYSGHGDRKEQFKAGYWVPVDAEKRMSAQYVANTDIIAMIGGMKARHVLVVADACFAGELVRGAIAQQPLHKSPSFYENESRRLSRKALTSGAMEPVLDGGREDHSIFAFYFLQALRDIEGDYFDVSDVFGRVRTAVGMNARQMPLYDPLWGTGDDGGEFIFVRK